MQSAQAGDIEITPYSNLYVTVMYGTNGTVRIRANRNVPVTVHCPTDSLTDTEVYIFSASHLKELGSLANLKTKFVTLTRADKLQVLPVGSEEPGYQNLNMTELGLGNNTLLEYLDIRGLPNLSGAMNLSALYSLEAFYGTGSGITSLTFAQGAPVRTARVPAVGSLTARDLINLESFSMDGTNLQSIWVENSPAIDTLSLCRSATGLIRGRLTDVNWTDANADVVMRLAKLQHGGGMDPEGNTIDGFVLTGVFSCQEITQDEINTIVAAFPGLQLNFGQIVQSYSVVFRNWDGTEYPEASQTVRQGGTALNPVAAGIISTPLKESTVEENFIFTGWDQPLENIQTDMILTAQFRSSDRYYTVNWWYDESESSLLQTDTVIAHGSAQWNGPDLVKANGSIWAGWDGVAEDVTGNLDLHALFLEPELPDTIPDEFDYLYSSDANDNRAFNEKQFFGILYYGREKDYFRLGDRIKLVCKSEKFVDTEIVLELRSWKHFDSAEKQGQMAGPYFGMVGVMNNAQQQYNKTDTNTGGFPASTAAVLLNDVIFPELPQFMREIIEKIKVFSSAGNTSAEIVSMDAYLTLESRAELGWDAEVVPYVSEISEGADEVTFSCYTNNDSRIKKLYNGVGSAATYWTRSPRVTDDRYAWHVMVNGGEQALNAGGPSGISFGFCLRHNMHQQ